MNRQEFDAAVALSVEISNKIVDALPDRMSGQMSLFAIVRGAMVAAAGVAQLTGRNATVETREQFKGVVAAHVMTTLSGLLDDETGKSTGRAH